MIINPNELFGPNGLIPLDKYMGMGSAICPHCNTQLYNISFPPPGLVVIHKCPSCGLFIIPFVRKLVAVDGMRVEGNPEKAREHIVACLYSTITPVLMRFVAVNQLSEANAKEFLDTCYRIVYDMVGEKEDANDFLQKVNHNASQKEIDNYMASLCQNNMKAAKKKEAISTQQIDQLKKDLNKINSVDEFLTKYF